KHAIRGDYKDAVERKKIRRQRDPEIILVRHDMAATPADAKPADTSAHQQNPEGMGEFMSEDIKHDRPGQAEESDQPEDCAQGEEPKFFARPKPLGDGRACKDREKCLAENGADWQQKDRKNKLHPSCGDDQWIRRGNESRRP